MTLTIPDPITLIAELVIAAELAVLIHATYKLAGGLRGVLTLVPAVGLLRQIAEPQRPLATPGVPPGGIPDEVLAKYAASVGQSQSPSMHLPYDVEQMGRGTFNQPGLTNEEVVEMMERRNGQ